MSKITPESIQFNYYPANNKATKPLGVINIHQFFEAIRKPKPEIIETFSRIRQAEQDGNKSLKAELKSKLYSFTPCVLVKDCRTYQSIESFTGLMVLDFDKLDPTDAVKFKYFLFEEYHFIIAVWLSASACGVRALVNIPVVSNTNEFKALFMGLEHYEMGMYKGFDPAPKNAVLPLYLSYDPDILVGSETHEIWTKTYTPPLINSVTPYKIKFSAIGIDKIMKSAIDKIHDNGHPQLRAAAYTLGGYVGAGYIDKPSAIELINTLIDSNRYLSSKGFEGQEGYKTTAKTMIEKGVNVPLFFKTC